MKTRLLFFLVSLFFITHIYAQEAPKIKFGKVSEEELKMTVYESDTTAEAVILFDEGQSEVRYDLAKKRFILTFERFLRVKILKQSGTDWGNFTISLYSSTQSQEELNAVDGVTFNMEGGKVEKVTMKKEAIFKERENKYWEVARLSLPSVKVGSVIDLKYAINSPLLWNLRTWKFQYSIPVKWSLYEVTYPEYFNYNQSSLGYHNLHSRTQTSRTENINFTSTYQTSGNAFSGGGQRERVNETISYQATTYSYTAKNVPAIKEEPYTSTLENYTSRAKFELANIDFTKIGGEYKSYTNSWTTIANDLLIDEDFGHQINGGNFAEDVVRNLIAGKSTEMEKMIAIYSHIQKNVKWDNQRSYLSARSIKKTYNDKTGNSADINLLLLAMLQKAEISAYPVILSTRDHGMLSPVHATLSDCNYVIVKAMIDNKPVLLDATDPDLPAGLLPYRCLNGNGMLIKKDFPEEVDISNAKSTSSTAVMLELKEGKLSGTILTRLSGLDAFNFRKEVKAAGGPQSQFETLKNNTHGIEYSDYAYNYLDSLYFPVEKRYNITIDNDSEDEASILYINPIVSGRLEKNPFSSPTRVYPVDFGVPSIENYKFNLAIPEGYKVEELPKNKNILLGENDGKFSYVVGQMGDRIIVNMRFAIEKTLFIPSEYNNLKEFFDMVVAKEAEQIVLKKTEAQ